MLRLETVESTTPTLEIDASSCVLARGYRTGKGDLGGDDEVQVDEASFRQGCVCTRRPRCESKRPVVALVLPLVPTLAWTLSDRDTLRHLCQKMVARLHVR